MNSIFRRRFRRPTRRELRGLASESQSKQSDSSHAIDAGTGNEIWKRSLNTPVAQSSLPCDNIDPLGVTGTPVIDESTDAIYLNAAVDGPSGRRHSFSRITEGRLAPPGLAGRRRGCARRGTSKFRAARRNPRMQQGRYRQVG